MRDLRRVSLDDSVTLVVVDALPGRWYSSSF